MTVDKNWTIESAMVNGNDPLSTAAFYTDMYGKIRVAVRSKLVADC